MRVFFATPMIAPGGCVLGEDGSKCAQLVCEFLCYVYRRLQPPIAVPSRWDAGCVYGVVVVLADGCG